jgi:hypothetical protein
VDRKCGQLDVSAVKNELGRTSGRSESVARNVERNCSFHPNKSNLFFVSSETQKICEFREYKQLSRCESWTHFPWSARSFHSFSSLVSFVQTICENNLQQIMTLCPTLWKLVAKSSEFFLLRSSDGRNTAGKLFLNGTFSSKDSHFSPPQRKWTVNFSKLFVAENEFISWKLKYIKAHLLWTQSRCSVSFGSYGFLYSRKMKENKSTKCLLANSFNGILMFLPISVAVWYMEWTHFTKRGIKIRSNKP